ncbi:hypothetical protein BC943DRAFT_321085 [Umbelopsis sp. AD052]|nr:hypothetical protein BC943DRAFT_321085 [Umbelopsis sp. AD052]
MDEPREETSTSASHMADDVLTASDNSPDLDQDKAPLSNDTSQLRRRHTPAVATSDEASTKDPEEDVKRRSSFDNNVGGGFYECNICFDTATHPVVTVCGHLFCWSCLAQWLHQTSRNPTCPVCKAGCGKDKVVPVYGRGREQMDPREDPTIPTRPPGQRPAPVRDPNSSFFGAPMRGASISTGNFAISAGFGVFPGLFGVTINHTRMSPHARAQQDAFMARLFLMIGALFIITIVYSG